MARDIDVIYNGMIADIAARPELAALNSVSKYAIYRLFVFVLASAIYVLEVLFDNHTSEVKQIIANEKAHKPKWYAAMAKAFQFGYSLVQDQDYYDNSALTDAEIEASRVIKYCVVVEIPKGLRVKTATIIAGDLAPVPSIQHVPFQEYMHEIKDGGVRLFYVNQVADSLKQHWKIFYNPLILDATGQRLDGTNNTPVQSAIDSYLKQMDFNTLYVNQDVIEYLKGVEGVVIPHLVSAEARYGALAYNSIEVEYLPDAGYLRFADPSDLTIEFIPHGII